MFDLEYTELRRNEEIGLHAANLDHCVVVKLVINILDKWECGVEQKGKIFGLDPNSWKEKEIILTDQQLIRASYIANIHAVLRIKFNNESNIYGFMRMPNKNEFFDGKQPIEVISEGGVESLKATYYELKKNLLVKED